MLIDIHSHSNQGGPGKWILESLRLLPETIPDLSVLADSISAGIHPWDADRWDIAELSTLQDLYLHPKLRMIGEIGLDRSCSIPFDQQSRVFSRQLELAESCGKPVLLHSVRSQQEVLQMKNSFPKVDGWVIHGFRGHPKLAATYLHHGFFLSFGSHFNGETLRACPLDRMFLETDDSGLDISTVYQKAAVTLGIPVSELEMQIEENFHRLIG